MVCHEVQNSKMNHKFLKCPNCNHKKQIKYQRFQRSTTRLLLLFYSGRPMKKKGKDSWVLFLIKNFWNFSVFLVLIFSLALQLCPSTWNLDDSTRKVTAHYPIMQLTELSKAQEKKVPLHESSTVDFLQIHTHAKWLHIKYHNQNLTVLYT